MFSDANKNGFSLIELVIVVTVIAILAAIAYPSYQDFIHNARRTDGQSIMLDIQILQERYRVNNPAYGALSDLGSIPSSEYYTFAVSGTSATAYTITATAKSGTSQANDTGCTSMRMSIDQASTESIDQAGTKIPADCWKK